MSMTTTFPSWAAIKSFVAALETLEAGELARLRRNAGSGLADSHQALGLFYGRLLRTETPSWMEERFFLVATLFPLDRRLPDGPSLPQSFGASLRTVRRDSTKEKGKNNADSLDRRMERLLDADEQQLPYLLRREVQYLASEAPTRRVDWATLLQDLLDWDHPRRKVQRRWARDYFGAREKETNEGGPTAAKETI